MSAEQPAPSTPQAGAEPEPRTLIGIDDFGRVEMRVGTVLLAERIPKADRLLRLEIELGEASPRQVLAGIAAYYQPEELVGRRVVVVANLQPRKMRFGTSEGMMLAAGPGGKDIFVLSPDSGAAPGMRIK
jgi:methionyl-tRNA synthetase